MKKRVFCLFLILLIALLLSFGCTEGSNQEKNSLTDNENTPSSTTLIQEYSLGNCNLDSVSSIKITSEDQKEQLFVINSKEEAFVNGKPISYSIAELSICGQSSTFAKIAEVAVEDGGNVNGTWFIANDRITGKTNRQMNIKEVTENGEKVLVIEWRDLFQEENKKELFLSKVKILKKTNSALRIETLTIQNSTEFLLESSIEELAQTYPEKYDLLDYDYTFK